MYGMITYNGAIFGVDVGKYSIHGASGYVWKMLDIFENYVLKTFWKMVNMTSCDIMLHHNTHII